MRVVNREEAMAKSNCFGMPHWRASEASESVQIQAGAVRIYIYIYICMEVRMSY